MDNEGIAEREPTTSKASVPAAEDKCSVCSASPCVSGLPRPESPLVQVDQLGHPMLSFRIVMGKPFIEEQ